MYLFLYFCFFKKLIASVNIETQPFRNRFADFATASRTSQPLRDFATRNELYRKWQRFVFLSRCVKRRVLRSS